MGGMQGSEMQNPNSRVREEDEGYGASGTQIHFEVLLNNTHFLQSSLGRFCHFGALPKVHLSVWFAFCASNVICGASNIIFVHTVKDVQAALNLAFPNLCLLLQLE